MSLSTIDNDRALIPKHKPLTALLATVEQFLTREPNISART